MAEGFFYKFGDTMRKTLITVFTIFSLVIFSSSCSNELAPKLIGAWEIDSVFDYHNGFTYTDRNPEPREEHEYRADGTVVRKGMGQQKTYYYELEDRLLLIKDMPGGRGTEFTIHKLTDSMLVLRKKVKPIFRDDRSEHYKLQYFHRKQ